MILKISSKLNSMHIFTMIAAAVFVALNLLVFSVSRIHAQIDPTFGTDGTSTTDLAGQDTPIDSFVLADGKILVVAQSGVVGQTKYYFIRYNADGTADGTYGTGGKVQLPITFQSGFQGNYQILKAVRQSDGKILLVGNDNDNGLIMRFNDNGTLDSGFASGGIHRPNITQNGRDGITSVVIQPDGKILVGGFAQGAAGLEALYLLRYTANGALDETFGTEGWILHQQLWVTHTGAMFMFLQSTGKIVTVEFEPNSTPLGRVRRFNADGSADNSYAIPFAAQNGSFGLAFMQSDDKILLASSVQKTETLERQHNDTAISRYNADGSPDTGFGTGGTATYDVTSYQDNAPTAMQVMPDGQIVVADIVNVSPNRSKYRGSMLALTRLSTGGTINGKFLVTKSDSVLSSMSQISVLTDGKILAVQTLANPSNDILLTRSSGIPLQTYRLRGVPFDFAPAGTFAIADPSVFRPSDRRWYINGVFPGYFFGLSDDIPVASDYIQDFSTEMAVFRPSTGKWYIARNYFDAGSNYLEIQWGQNGDVPTPADFDGDGKSDLAVFRPSNGTWYIRNSNDNSGTTVQWGLSGDKPAIGDFDGDGKYDVAVFRPSDGNWYILRSSDGQAIILHFGLSGDIPVQEDYDGDGKTDISVWRPSEGNWYRLNSTDGSFYAFHWGLGTDVPVPGDYDGDLKTDVAVWRPSIGRWYVFQSSNDQMNVFNWGLSTDIPLQGKN